ncbi:cyclin PHO80-like protein, partial [Cladochytrium replicatum]
FSRFCEEILKATSLAFSVLLLALKFIHRLKTRHPLLKGAEGSECRLMVCSLMLAMKVLLDNTYTNRTWNKVSKIPIEELNVMEIEFLLQLNFDLYVDEDEYFSWIHQ